MSAELVPLSTDEAAQFAECEWKIRAGLRTFMEVGQALAKIRDARLYRQTHTTFEAYCEQEWQFSRQRAHQMIDAAAAAEAMSTMVDIPLPTTERQARELAGLSAETAAEVMRTAQPGPSGAVTAGTIRDARRLIAPEPAPIVEQASDAGRTLTPADPPAPDLVGEWLDGDPALKDREYLAAFTKIFARSDDYLEFDPERIGLLASDIVMHTLEDLPGRAERFLAKARAAVNKRSWSEEDRAEYDALVTDALRERSVPVWRDIFLDGLDGALQARRYWAKDVEHDMRETGADRILKSEQEVRHPRVLVAHDGRVLGKAGRTAGRTVRKADGSAGHEQTLFDDLTFEQLRERLPWCAQQIGAYEREAHKILRLLVLETRAPGTTTPAEACVVLGIAIEQWLLGKDVA